MLQSSGCLAGAWLVVCWLLGDCVLLRCPQLRGTSWRSSLQLGRLMHRLGTCSQAIFACNDMCCDNAMRPEPEQAGRHTGGTTGSIGWCAPVPPGAAGLACRPAGWSGRRRRLIRSRQLCGPLLIFVTRGPRGAHLRHAWHIHLRAGSAHSRWMPATVPAASQQGWGSRLNRPGHRQGRGEPGRCAEQQEKLQPTSGTGLRAALRLPRRKSDLTRPVMPEGGAACTHAGACEGSSKSPDPLGRGHAAGVQITCEQAGGNACLTAQLSLPQSWGRWAAAAAAGDGACVAACCSCTSCSTRTAQNTP